MRLINADAVLDAMREKLEMQELYLPIHLKELVIDDMPTVDAEPIVRCEDCDTEPCDYYTSVEWCSRGHRRKNEKR